jgi:hypothetical protein
MEELFFEVPLCPKNRARYNWKTDRFGIFLQGNFKIDPYM